jgi:hypothetical protein
MLDLNHRLRSGKYAGQTVGYVYKKDKRYFNWVVENRPEMLKSHKAKPTPKPVHSNTKPTYVDPPDIPKPGAIKPMSPNEAFDFE